MSNAREEAAWGRCSLLIAVLRNTMVGCWAKNPEMAEPADYNPFRQAEAGQKRAAERAERWQRDKAEAKRAAALREGRAAQASPGQEIGQGPTPPGVEG